MGFVDCYLLRVLFTSRLRLLDCVEVAEAAAASLGKGLDLVRADFYHREAALLTGAHHKSALGGGLAGGRAAPKE